MISIEKIFLKIIALAVLLSVNYICMCEYFSLSFPGVGIYLEAWMVKVCYVLFLLGWEYCSPLKKGCSNRMGMELLFHLIPFEILMLIIFAQWHPVSAILIVALTVVLIVMMVYNLYKLVYRYCFSEKKIARYKGIMYRRIIMIVSVAFLLPCIVSTCVYNLGAPVYTSNQEPVYNTEQESDKETEEISDYDKELFICMNDKQWDGYGINEKINVLQRFVNYEAKYLGMNSITLTSEYLGLTILGEYESETNKIWINLECLSDACLTNCIEVICHEVYHAYQNYLISNINLEDAIFQTQYFEELISWKNNQENYVTSEKHGYEAYENQPLESSAREYSKNETMRIKKLINIE